MVVVREEEGERKTKIWHNIVVLFKKKKGPFYRVCVKLNYYF